MTLQRHYSPFCLHIFIGMIEVKVRQTAAFRKEKILEIIKQYGIHIEQVFSVTCDNGANMLTAVRQLKLEYEMEYFNWDESSETEYTERHAKEDL